MDFSNKIVAISHFAPTYLTDRMRAEAEQNISKMTRSYIPTHKKGKCLSYEDIRKYTPYCHDFYESVRQHVSIIVGEKVYKTPTSDQSSLSLLCYDEEGDHINWHYDHNFYKGRHFTVLLSIVNEAESGGESSCKLLQKKNEVEIEYSTSVGNLIVFEGAKILHKASPLGKNEKRILLSMTFCTDPRISWWKEIIRRFKDIAFHGIKALWK